MADSDDTSKKTISNDLQKTVKDALAKTVQADKEWDEEELLEKSILLGEQIADLKANRELRKVFSARTYRYMWGWTSFVFVTLWAHAMHFPLNFTLPDTVLYVLAGSTTVTVLGLAAIILKGLFPEGKEKQGKVKSQPKTDG